MGCSKDNPFDDQNKDDNEVAVADLAPDAMPDCTLSTTLYDNKKYVFKNDKVTIKWDGDYTVSFFYEKKSATTAQIKFNRSSNENGYRYNGNIVIQLTFESAQKGTCVYTETYTSNLIGDGTDVEEGSFELVN